MAIRAAHIAPQKASSAGRAVPARRRGSAAAANNPVSSHRAASSATITAPDHRCRGRELDHMPLPAPRGQVQPPVGAQQRIQTALVGRIGVEHPVPLAEEHADPRSVRAGPDVGVSRARVSCGDRMSPHRADALRAEWTAEQLTSAVMGRKAV